MNQELIDYIKKSKETGLGDEQIKQSLFEAGWQKNDVDEAFTQQDSSHSQVQNTDVLPGATTLFLEAWEIYKKRFGTLIGIMAIPVSISILTVIIVIAYIYLSGANLAVAVEYGNLFVVSVLILGIAYWIINLWAVVAIFYSIKDSIGIKESYNRAISKIFSYYWIALLLGFFIISGFGLFIVPAFILMVWFSFATWTLIIENERGINALLKSKEYVKGRWFGVAWRLVFFVFLIGVVSILISFLLSKIKITGISKIDSDIISQIEKAISFLFVTPLFTTYLFVLYGHLKSLRGDFVFEPKNKWKFIIIAILGLLMFLFSFSFLYSRRAVVNEYISKFGQEKNLQNQSIIKEINIKEINKSDIQNQIADWQIYKDDEHGFEFKYPKNWTYQKVDKFDEIVFYPKGLSSEMGFSMQVLPNVRAPLVDLIKLKEKAELVTNLAEIAIDNNTVVVADEIPASIGFKDIYIGNNKNLILQFTISKNFKYLQLLNKILSTVNFIEQLNIQDEMAGWQTYIDEKNKFLIKYPESWEVLVNESSRINISLRDKKYNKSFEWPGLNINDMDAVGEFALSRISNLFVNEDIKNEVIRIKFLTDNNTLYASCALYIDIDIINYCNKIFPTFKFINQTEGWQIYRNEDYGFQLTFSDDWKGYRVVEEINGKGVSFSFEMPTDNKLWENGSGYVSIFVVGVVPASEWRSDLWESMAHNDKYYFMGVSSSSAPQGFRVPTSDPLFTFKLIE